MLVKTGGQENDILLEESQRKVLLLLNDLGEENNFFFNRSLHGNRLIACWSRFCFRLKFLVLFGLWFLRENA